MTAMPRLLAATVFSPLVIIPTVFVSMCLVHAVDLIRIDYLTAEALADLQRAFAEAIGIALFGIVVAWVVNLLVGLPVYAFLRVCDLAEPVPCGLLGATLGLLGGYSALPAPEFYVLMTACGGTVAMAFCELANGGRPVPRVEEPGIWY